MAYTYLKGINIGGWMNCFEDLTDDFAAHVRTFITESDIDRIASWGADHIRLPFQNDILNEDTYALIERIRREVPGISLRTTLMVGFPTETDSNFEELCQYVKDMRFERMGAFAYCEEDSTPAQRLYDDNVRPEVKQQRLDRLMRLQETIAAEFNKSLVGKQMTAIVDREEDDYYILRTQYDSPEVDTELLVRKDMNRRPQIGCFYNVTIDAYENFDLYGHINQ